MIIIQNTSIYNGLLEALDNFKPVYILWEDTSDGSSMVYTPYSGNFLYNSDLGILLSNVYLDSGIETIIVQGSSGASSSDLYTPVNLIDNNSGSIDPV